MGMYMKFSTRNQTVKAAMSQMPSALIRYWTATLLSVMTRACAPAGRPIARISRSVTGCRWKRDRRSR